ncbi:MAG: hypothetical protein AB7I33_03460 [Gemmatimonadales bacterium]
MIADPNWSAGLSLPRRTPEGIKAYQIDDVAKVFDGIVEVYDCATWHLLAAGRFDNPIFLSVGHGRVARFLQRPNGSHVVSIERITLTE